jgi:SnoaL-like protein
MPAIDVHALAYHSARRNKSHETETQMAAPDPRFAQILDLTITPDLYAEIRDLWLLHVTNEERLFVPHTDEVTEDAMKKMLAAFTPDCVMELVATGDRWTGYDGARAFYDAFLSSLGGMEWVPQALVIGPQGVLDVVNMTGTLPKPFAGLTAIGDRLALQWVIFFPWVAKARRFKGEFNYDIRPLGSNEQTSIPTWLN